MMEASHEELNFVGLQINSEKKKQTTFFTTKSLSCRYVH